MDKAMLLKSLLIVALVALMVGGAGLWGCNAAQEVSLEELFAEPEHYDGKDVIIEGFYYGAFEVNVLAERLVYLGLGEGPIVPIGGLIWIEGSIGRATIDSLYWRPEDATYPTEIFGKIRIEGKFEYGEAYGHVGNYDYQITAVSTAALPWSPDEISR